ncbi:MAG: hypothetical protein QXX41_15065 [Nitrososphaerota archaeon]
MASTTGGFLIGFGLCIFLFSFGASFVLAQYYAQVMEWRDEAEQLYAITHSPGYEASMNALEKISPHANQIADTISLIPGLSPYAEPLRQIGGAGSNMRSVYYASESIYQAIQIFEIAPQYLEYAMIFGLFLMAIGIILVAKARRQK